MNKLTRFFTSSILFAALLVAVGRGSITAPEVAQAQSDAAPLPQPNQVDNIRINELPPMAPGVVLVGLKSGVTVSMGRLGVQASDVSLDAALANIGARDIEPVFPTTGRRLTIASVGVEIDPSHVYRLRLAPDADVLRVARDLNANPAVAYAEPDYLAHIIATPNDPLYPGQWGLPQINAPAAWDVVTGTTDVVIAVVDSGLDTSHLDLAGQLWVNPGEITDNGVDDDNNGHVDDIHGWNIVGDDANLSDNTGHGTQVAGVIAATTDNGEGVAGVCWNCRLMVVKVTQPGGVANYSDVAAGVAYAAQKGAEVINLSLGGYSDSATLRVAIAAASQTAVIIGGAGNNNVLTPFYPAAYDDYVLAVAGTTSSDTKVGTSNYGTWVDVSAPGEAITTTFSGSGYGSTSGTSMAAPFASGLAGLLRSQYPDWSADLVRAQIVHTVDGIDGLNLGYEGKLGSGRINAGQAVTTVAQPLLTYQSHTVDKEPDGRPEPGDAVDLDVTLYNDWADVTNVQATLSTSDSYVTITVGTVSYGDVATFESKASSTPFRFSLSSSTPYAYDVLLILDVTADGAYATTAAFTVTTASGIEHVSGVISSDTAWTSDRTYVVDGNVGVQSGVTLTIEPGTVIKFDGDYSLQVQGTLIADGTPTAPILFTSNIADPEPWEGWRQILFDDSSVDAVYDTAGNYIAGSILRYTRLERAFQGVWCSNAAPFIDHNTFADSDGHTGIWCDLFGGGGGDDLLVISNNTVYGASHISLSGDSRALVTGNHWRDSRLHISGDNNITFTRNTLATDARFDGRGGVVAHNLFAGQGLELEQAVIVSNTIIGNTSDFIESTVIRAGGETETRHNNIVRNQTQYDLYNFSSWPITATNNWWGTTNTATIDERIYDQQDDVNAGPVTYVPILNAPEPSAPPYLADVTLTPASPVGIQIVTFDLTFSGPMDQSINPTVVFDSVNMNRSVVYSTTNSGVASNRVEAIAIDEDQTVWFATDQGVSALSASGGWTTYDASNSGILNNWILDVAFDREGNGWFGVNNSGVAMRSPAGDWTSFTWDNSPLICQQVNEIAVDLDGNRWFGCGGGGVGDVSVLLTSGDWITYTKDNSGLEGCQGTEIAIDSSNNKWFGQRGIGQPVGVSKLTPSGAWTTYNTTNSGLVSDFVGAIAEDKERNMWFGSWDDGISVLSPSGVWITYTTSNSDLVNNSIRDIVVDTRGQIWIATYAGLNIVSPGGIWEAFTREDGNLAGFSVRTVAIQSDGNAWLSTDIPGYPGSSRLSLFHRNGGYSVSGNSIWLDELHWQATADINVLIPRDTYTISVNGARGSATMMSGTLALPLPGGGMEIPLDTRFRFTVDYAGEITDRTPPDPPSVIAGGVEGDASTVEAMWWASDLDSSITGYRYAIGSAAGATDIVNWTTTSSSSITRSGLGLIEGRQYWLAVQARNEGGLWSASGYGAFVAGQPFHRVFLPLVLRNW